MGSLIATAPAGLLDSAVILASARLPPETASAARARALVRDALRTHGAATGLARFAADTELVTGELAANAIIHAAADPVVVTVAVPGPGQVLVVVEDGSPVPPVIRDRPDEHGHGLRMVDAVSVRWGWTPVTGRAGKQVYALLGEQS